MTSATIPRGQARIAAVAAGLAAALVLTTGCSSDDGGGGDDSPSSTGSAPSGSADTGGGTGGSDGSDGSGGSKDKVGALEGSWLATKSGKAVALVITGSEAGLFSTGGSVCSGTAGETSGMRMIELKCSDGNKDRAEGMVDSVDSTTLKVTWEGLGEETYTKAEGGKMPSGLPTASLGS
ncbi:hypothetical protein ACFWCA_24070 [Streptomyces phaeochromogenes]|uniref:Secreted protein n=1 Tax=Streptomyces phaeochromogenes TaxID=1923 RepID=A0ABZ1HED5_STRPH|nr:hypothetical protein [Streptomyces phaeochromogenes]WRZ31400.1 hypothetical protein OG931_28485 [Streptomyces phaeochromogenes]WSD16965.1 hypothetical protein OHB35_29050 [Streptomyces phaeochromogenes]